MFQTILFTGLGAIVGAAGSILLMSFVKNFQPELKLATSAFLGAVCSSILICREKSIQKKLSRETNNKKKGTLTKLRRILFWFVLIGGLVAVAIAVFKIFGQP